MPHSAQDAAEQDHAAISEVVGIREQTLVQRLVASQPFWVAIALVVLVMYMTALEPTFGTVANAANVTRNFAPFGIMALGMTVVIITGGIDLSVGSVMGLVAIVAGLFLTWNTRGTWLSPWGWSRALPVVLSTGSSWPMSECRPLS